MPYLEDCKGLRMILTTPFVTKTCTDENVMPKSCPKSVKKVRFKCVHNSTYVSLINEYTINSISNSMLNFIKRNTENKSHLKKNTYIQLVMVIC